MNLFRTLQAVVDPRIEAYTATGLTAQVAPTEHDTPAPSNQHVFAALAFLAEHPGVPHHTDPALANLLGR